jgi:NitT/TauT family transport system substrate-binding protein
VPTDAAPAASAGAPAAAAPPPLSPIKFGRIGGLSDGGVAIALARGYFAAQGLDLEVTQHRSLTDQAPLLATGELDVGSGGLGAAIFNAAARGVGLKIVADKGIQRPGFPVVSLYLRKALADSGEVARIADLRGRRVGLASPGVSAEIILVRALESNGLQLSDVHTELLSFQDMGIALANGAIDLAMGQEPTTGISVQKGDAVLWVRGDEVYPNQQVAVLVYSELFPPRQPEAAERFLVAYLQGVRAYNDAFAKGIDKDQVIEAIAHYTGFAPDVVARALPPGLDPDGAVNVDSLVADAQWYYERGYAKELPTDVAALVDDRYRRAAVAALGPYR